MYVALTMVRALRDAGHKTPFLFSTTTSTGFKIADKKIDHSKDMLIYFPIDFPGVAHRVLSLFKPTEILMVEGEYWPIFIRAASKKNIPLKMINGRISDQSFSRYVGVKWWIADLLSCFELFCMQSELDKQRIISIGAPAERVISCGSIKFDMDKQLSNGYLKRFFPSIELHADSERTLLLMGSSTWPGEEAILIKTYMSLLEEGHKVKLLIAPRHAERADVIEDIIQEAGCRVVRRTQPMSNNEQDKPVVYLLDSTGELSALYPDVDLVFVGKSLISKGGQNPIEPAAYGCALITGPYMENFRGVMEVIDNCEARIVIEGQASLESAVKRLLVDHVYRQKMKERSLQAVEKGKGAIKRTIHYLNVASKDISQPVE
jgi:3-deoxy-D-manno-octulosonic-acid transferase